MPIRVVYLDLDDTICDTIGTREIRARKAFQALTAERSDLDPAAFLKRVLEPIVPTAVRGVPDVVDELGLTGTAAAREAIDCWFFRGTLDLLSPIEGVLETVKYLSRMYRLGVVTNGPEEMQLAKINHMGLSPYFGTVVTSEAAGYEKPNLAIFLRALELDQVPPDQSVFVGDRMEVDVTGAKGAGMRAIWFNHWGGTLEAGTVQPDAVITGFDQLPEAIARL